MSSDIVKHLIDEARGEVDVRLIGRVEKRTRDQNSGSGEGRRGRIDPLRVVDLRGPTPWYRNNTRPLLIGASVGHVQVTAGTLGAFVQRSGRRFILSNNHVLANEGRASEGDVVLQRGTADGGRPSRDQVAALDKWVQLKKNGVNLVDAAVAGIPESEEIDPTLLRGLVNGTDRRLAGLGPDFLDEGTVVYKVGRTTGPTAGRVTAFELDNVVISFDSGNLRFDGQVEIEGIGSEPFSDGGDSGSLIVDEEMGAVALLFAGGDLGGTNGLGLTYANPIGRVLTSLKADLLLG